MSKFANLSDSKRQKLITEAYDNLNDFFSEWELVALKDGVNAGVKITKVDSHVKKSLDIEPDGDILLMWDQEPSMLLLKYIRKGKKVKKQIDVKGDRYDFNDIYFWLETYPELADCRLSDKPKKESKKSEPVIDKPKKDKSKRIIEIDAKERNLFIVYIDDSDSTRAYLIPKGDTWNKLKKLATQMRYFADKEQYNDASTSRTAIEDILEKNHFDNYHQTQVSFTNMGKDFVQASMWW